MRRSMLAITFIMSLAGATGLASELSLESPPTKGMDMDGGVFPDVASCVMFGSTDECASGMYVTDECEKINEQKTGYLIEREGPANCDFVASIPPRRIHCKTYCQEEQGRANGSCVYRRVTSCGPGMVAAAYCRCYD